MKQMSVSDAEYAGKPKQTRCERFLIEMDRVGPWKGLIVLIESHYPRGEGGRWAYPLMAMMRGHLMQNWFGYGDSAMDGALYETTILRQFVGLHRDRIPNAIHDLQFPSVAGKYELCRGLVRSTTKLTTMFALSSLWMAKKQFLIAGEVRL